MKLCESLTITVNTVKKQALHFGPFRFISFTSVEQKHGKNKLTGWKKIPIMGAPWSNEITPGKKTSFHHYRREQEGSSARLISTFTNSSCPLPRVSMAFSLQRCLSSKLTAVVWVPGMPISITHRTNRMGIDFRTPDSNQDDSGGRAAHHRHCQQRCIKRKYL